MLRRSPGSDAYRRVVAVIATAILAAAADPVPAMSPHDTRYVPPVPATPPASHRREPMGRGRVGLLITDTVPGERSAGGGGRIPAFGAARAILRRHGYRDLTRLAGGDGLPVELRAAVGENRTVIALVDPWSAGSESGIPTLRQLGVWGLDRPPLAGVIVALDPRDPETQASWAELSTWLHTLLNHQERPATSGPWRVVGDMTQFAAALLALAVRGSNSLVDLAGRSERRARTLAGEANLTPSHRPFAGLRAAGPERSRHPIPRRVGLPGVDGA